MCILNTKTIPKITIILPKITITLPIITIILPKITIKLPKKNKNWNIHKNKAQEVRWSDKYCQIFYILPNCNSNHHTEFEIDRTILTCLN